MHDETAAPAARLGARSPGLGEGLLTLRQVAQYLGVSLKTVRRLVSTSKLHCIRVGRVLRFQKADLFRYVEARRE